MKKIIILFGLLLLVSCNNSDDSYMKVEEVIGQFDGEDAEIIENIMKTDNDQAVFYDEFNSKGEKIGSSMGVEWGDRSITYTLNEYNPNQVIEKVSLVDGKEATYIDLANNKYYNHELKVLDSKDPSYPDNYILSEKLQYKDLKGIEQSDGQIRLDFADDTYMVFDNNYMLLEEKELSGGEFIVKKLSHVEKNPDELFEYYMSLIENMDQAESLDDYKD
ncbi:MAG: hypothetical protein Q4D88_03440 [Anaerococcus sp.]|nr:hypothetical protein [Anaerococcus sp.]